MSNITVRNVHKSFGKAAIIRDMNLDIAAGEFMVLLGPSGCGKSTLLRMIAGLEAITQGEIAIGGTIVNQFEPRERGCAMVFQNYALYPHMTVAENIGYALKVAGLKKSDREMKVGKVAETLGLSELLSRKPAQLSGGQRQRVAMGRAMIREPKIFLYDEPLSNLDARLRVAMRVEIRKLHQRLGTTTLFVTHDQVEAMTLADRIVVMKEGHIEQVGKPAEIYARPASTYVAGFVGSPGMNLMQVTVDPAAGQVKLLDGQLLDYDSWRWPRLVAGDIILGFRAEAVEQLKRGRSLRAEYQFVEELGAARLLHATIGKSSVIALSNDYQRFSPGEHINFHVEPSALHFFDANSGRRIGDEILEYPSLPKQRVGAMTV
jgi:sn-glycerol 3-phosphate transport system ATP-binding protein